jgi:hypothetical protein
MIETELKARGLEGALELRSPDQLRKDVTLNDSFGIDSNKFLLR